MTAVGFYQYNKDNYGGEGRFEAVMHEFGVLCQAIRMADRIAAEHNIRQVKHITLEIGEESGYVPLFFEKLFPAAIDAFPAMKGAQLRMKMVPGRSLQIRDIGY